MMVLIQYWNISIFVFGLPILAGLIGSKFLRKLLLKLAQKSDNEIDNALIKHCFTPLLWLIIFFIIRFAVGTSYPEEALLNIIRVGTSAGGNRPKAVIALNDRTKEVRKAYVIHLSKMFQLAGVDEETSAK